MLLKIARILDLTVRQIAIKITQTRLNRYQDFVDPEDLCSQPTDLGRERAPVEVKYPGVLEDAHDGGLPHDFLDQLVALEGPSRNRRLREHKLLHRHLKRRRFGADKKAIRRYDGRI